MIELLYTPILPCPEDEDIEVCEDIWASEAEDMQETSFKITYGYIGLMVFSVVGLCLLFWGFGTASERMNKRVRDAAFSNLVRQEVAWFDVRSPAKLTSRLADDAALLHAFAGEPIRTLVLNIASVLVGLVISFVYMWYVVVVGGGPSVSQPRNRCLPFNFFLLHKQRPFALLTMGIVPFLVSASFLDCIIRYDF